jgi:nitrite reductase/ring-hydroxylating ferredoxin subunit
MLSKADNELITQTGRGTPMGELMRRYWIPAFLSEELPGPDCPPIQVRILGEELIAFRDSQGRIGLLEEHCSHRGTSLFYGRNENCALTCVYHGWQYDVEGKILETPAEPAGSTFKDRLQHPAYPTHEAAGMVFAYLGPRDKMPLFPNFQWASVDPAHCYVTKAYQECNYLQGLEGECDSSHLSFLHRTLDPNSQFLYKTDTAPAYEIEETDFGVRLIALRKLPEDRTYVRISAFLMPLSCAIPVGRSDLVRDGYEVHFYTPVDDTHSWRFDFGFRPSSPIQPQEVIRRPWIGQDFVKVANAGNHYLIDREMQRKVNFTGMESFLMHDSMATESMGGIYDRSREHLGASDAGVIAVRRRMLESAKAFQRGVEPPGIVTDPALNDFRHADSLADTIDGRDWHSAFPDMVDSVETLAAGRTAVAAR